jgi:hypothetical protein
VEKPIEGISNKNCFPIYLIFFAEKEESIVSCVCFSWKAERICGRTLRGPVLITPRWANLDEFKFYKNILRKFHYFLGVDMFVIPPPPPS